MIQSAATSSYVFFRTVFVLLLVVLALPLSAMAQDGASEPVRSNTRNLFLNIQGVSANTSLNAPNFQNETTKGIGAKLGFGFSKAFTLYLGVDVSASKSANYDGFNVGMGQGYLGARFNLGAGKSNFVPYLDVAAASRIATLQTELGDVSLAGIGGTVGGGIAYFISPTVALDFGARYTSGSFNAAVIDGKTYDIQQFFGIPDVGSNALTFSLGFSFYPSR